MSTTPGAAGAAQKLTKKQKKAQAFRSRSKGKQTAEEEDVPEADLLDDDTAESEVKQKSKKRKRREEDEDGAIEEKNEEEDGEPKKKKRQRGGKKGNKSNGETGSRLLLFVGNLPYKVTREGVASHFSATCGEEPTVRLLTPKEPSNSTSNPNATSKSKGCAFIEFRSPLALQSALKLHHSTMGGRKINVELTAGGGGNSDARKKKLEEGRKRLLDEREKAAERSGEASKRKEGVKPVEEVPQEAETGEVKKKKKVRDRRIPKVDAEGNVKVRKRKIEAKAAAKSSGANSMRLGSRM